MGDLTESVKLSGDRNFYHKNFLRLVRIATINRNYKLPKILTFAIIFFSVFVILFQWPDSLEHLTVDSSWQGALTYFGEHHARFGQQIIYTYGPLGYLMAGLYVGGSYGWLASAQVVYYLVFASTAALLAVSVGSWIFNAGLIVFLFWFANYEFDSIGVLLIVFASALCLQKSPTLLKIVAASLVLSFISLVKFTFLIFSLFSLACLFGYLLAVGVRRLVAPLFVTYLAGFLFFWTAVAHQHIVDIGTFVRGSAEVAFGFPKTMGTPPPHEVVMPSAVLIGSFLLLLGLLVRVTPSWQKALARLFLFGVATLLVCEQGFVRADYDHIPVIPLTLQIMAILIFSLIVKEVSARTSISAGSSELASLVRSLSITSSAVMLFIILGSSLAVVHLVGRSAEAAGVTGRGSVSQAVHQFEERLSSLPNYSAVKNAQQAAWRGARKTYALPEFSGIIKGDTVDVFGDDVAIAILNGWNYRPRLSVQSFAAYTSYLQSENLAFVTGKNAPKFYVLNLQPIDDRLLPETDGPALFAILAGYEPVSTEAGYWLFQKHAAVPPRNRTVTLLSNSARLGQSIAVDALPRSAADQIELHLRPTLFKSFSLKNPWATLLITQQSGNKSSFKVPPLLFKLGFVFNPPINSNLDLYAALVAGNADPVQSFSVVLPAGFTRYFKPEFTYTIRRAQNVFPPKHDTGLMSALIGFSAPIYDAQSPSPVRMSSVENTDVLYVQAPGRFRMDVPAHTKTVTGSLGVLPGAFVTRPQTKEVEFKVEALDNARPTELLDSKLTASGMTKFQIQLEDSNTDQSLQFSSTCAPTCGGGWSYWSGIQFGPAKK